MSNLKRVFYAFHYVDGLSTTTGDDYHLAGEVRAYSSRLLRNAACNDLRSSYMDGSSRRHPVRAMTVSEIRGLRHHRRALDLTTDYGMHVRSTLVD